MVASGPVGEAKHEVLGTGGILTYSSLFCPIHCNNYILDTVVGGGLIYTAWISKFNDAAQWVDISTSTSMLTQWVGVVTQGRADYDQRVTQYTLSSTVDGINYVKYNGGQIFTGNYDRNTWVTYNFPTPIIARKIRISIVAWNEHISMRLGAYITSITCRA